MTTHDEITAAEWLQNIAGMFGKGDMMQNVTRWTLGSVHFARRQDSEDYRGQDIIRESVKFKDLEFGDVFSVEYGINGVAKHDFEKLADIIGMKFVDCDRQKYGTNERLFLVTTAPQGYIEWGMTDDYKLDYGDKLVNDECECGYGPDCLMCGEIGRQMVQAHNDGKDTECTCGPAQNFELRVDGSSGDIVTEAHLAFLMMRTFELFKRKHRSYGPRNISALGVKGVYVRLNDKMARLKRLVWDGVVNPLMDESEEDTWMDMVNYSLIALLLRDDKWPKE